MELLQSSSPEHMPRTISQMEILMEMYSFQFVAAAVSEPEAEAADLIAKKLHYSGAPAARRAAKRSPILIWERKGNP